ncbi:MAG TPA: bifunctional UDP-N-acetylglucosamine diphosphorylase/glucosamine-1-phosphate N-acetyltransferase GlmU, partial [Firmicutes bacterium]|nr:bifunctional UDP-N-acetylglucosamine diphosphorylase/glucosamine-1-phosphate N-acetyltransferase GlmU [Bacillota bacterium]
PGVILEGNTSIGRNCIIGPQTRLIDCQVGDGVSIEFSVARQSKIDDNCVIGPYAYLRPQTELATGVKVGDFVELKNSQVGVGSKIPHLSYVGDATIGSHVNIGAGTIFVNYDGRKKYRSQIEDDAFIGCNSNLVAPVHIGQEAYVAAGSTITKDVPAGSLALARSRQENKEGWVARRKQ